MKLKTNFSRTSQPHRVRLAITGLLAGAAAAQAHPGHSLTDASQFHLLTSPDHLAVLVTLGCGLCLAAQLVRRPLPRRAMQLAGSLGVIGAAVLFAARV